MARFARVVVFCLLNVASRAYAQAAEPNVAPVDAAAQAPPTAPPAIDPGLLDEARERITRGELLFEKGDFNGALAEYERAYALVQGHRLRYRALFNIARCYEKLFRYGRAIAYYQAYLAEGGAEAERRSEVEKTIEFLLDHLAKLRLETNARAQIWIDENLVGEAPSDVLLQAGRHVIALRAAGYEPQVFELQIAARQEQKRRVQLQPLSSVQGAAPSWFWASAIASGAALATGVVLGTLALHESNALDDQLSDKAERWRADPEQGRQVKRLALAADVAFGAAALFGASSLILYFVTDWRSERSPHDLAGTRATVVAGPSMVGVVGRGSF